MQPSRKTLVGQVAVVTGASRGIGRAIAISLAQAGAAVVVNYRTQAEAAQTVVDACLATGAKALAVQADVTKPAEVQHLFVAATALGSPGILVNNAGIASAQLLLDTSIEQWDDLLRSNLTAPFLCAKAVLPYMMRQQYGRIINISSIWGISGGACEVAYSASKGGLIAFTKALAKEVARAGITVNAVAPGAIETDMLHQLPRNDLYTVQMETPMGRLGSPDDVSHTVLFLASPGASFITGQVISPNGGLVI